MARKKRVVYNSEEMFRQDKYDDWIFAYFTGVRKAMPTANLKQIALNFQRDFHLSEDKLALEIILASYHRSLGKFSRHISIIEDNKYDESLTFERGSSEKRKGLRD